eukprot:CAMPEP_0174721042 /NCGR_PEP_ID=MMETSP1094-20130205/35187_1 /TAXON_ID=156173 /ORGANISM="Chrysochromulina brevifilum, Strain UTEX LB 985" /LENGTH=437 /DNA_ID=CAMNT_0015921653 /DNA_START=66 /DNA_END=1379 /DNA_ORIENTATION=+
MPMLRIRTKDGTERLQLDGNPTLSAVKTKIEQDLGVPLAQQALFRAEQAGPVARKGAAFAPTDDPQPLGSLGIANGDMLFLDYQIERENQAQYVEKDPFSTMVKEGDLRKQGKDQWTLTNFLDYRSSKEFVLGSPPEPHAKFVQVDGMAVQNFMNYMIQMGFQSKRVGYLYGRWTADDEGSAGVQVHAIYEPAQDCTSNDIVLKEDAEAEARLAKLCQMLNLVRVGVIIGHPAREYVFTVNEIILASKLHAQAVEADAENGKRFVTMKARPVLETEEDIEGVATVEAYQMTDQCVELIGRDAFTQSSTDPRVAKTAKDCCFVVEKKEQRKATVEMFISRVFDTARPLSDPFLSSGFVVENRITETQDASAMASHLRRSKGRQPFLKTVADLHFLFFLANFLDMNTDLPVLCEKVVAGLSDELEGFEMMINCYAGLDM